MSHLILAAALGSGLIAGVFLAFSSFVMQALARRPAAEGIAVMQAINVTVINPVFLGIFLGSAVLSVGLIAATLFNATPSAAIISGSLLYLIGTFGVTIAGNVPHNTRLARMDAASPVAAAYWLDYVRLWQRWNHLRTVMATLASMAFISALHGAQG